MINVTIVLIRMRGMATVLRSTVNSLWLNTFFVIAQITASRLVYAASTLCSSGKDIRTEV